MHDDKLTLSVTVNGKTITITQADFLTVREFLTTCKSLALAIDYSPAAWNDTILEIAEEIKDDDIQAQVDQYEKHLRETEC